MIAPGLLGFLIVSGAAFLGLGLGLTIAVVTYDLNLRSRAES
jgi:hypothetical protein